MIVTEGFNKMLESGTPLLRKRFGQYQRPDRNSPKSTRKTDPTESVPPKWTRRRPVPAPISAEVRHRLTAKFENRCGHMLRGAPLFFF